MKILEQLFKRVKKGNEIVCHSHLSQKIDAINKKILNTEKDTKKHSSLSCVKFTPSFVLSVH